MINLITTQRKTYLLISRDDKVMNYKNLGDKILGLQKYNYYLSGFMMNNKDIIFKIIK